MSTQFDVRLDNEKGRLVDTCNDFAAAERIRLLLEELSFSGRLTFHVNRTFVVVERQTSKSQFKRLSVQKG